MSATPTQGVLYWNHGARCLVRLAVSAMTLRRRYFGPATVAHEGDLPSWIADVLKELKVDTMSVPASNEYGLVKKSRLWRHMPYDHTMWIDSDTVVRGPVDDFFAAMANEHKCVVTEFAEWGTARGRMSRRIKAWEAVAPEMIKPALAYGHAVNTGIQGWVRGDPLLPAYQDLTERAIKFKVPKKTLDEIAMQLLVAKFPHVRLGEKWNTSCIYGSLDGAVIAHYHGHKHCRDNPAGDLWKFEFRELERRFPRHRLNIVENPQDASIAAWLNEERRPRAFRKDLTVVTAVNPAYADRARRNFKLWAKTPGLKEQNFVVFVSGFRRPKDRKFCEDLPNVTVVRWDYPHECTERERMIAAFVLGVPKAVKTEFWMKLDADTQPVAGRWDWPDYRSYAITSHKWGYTKMKGEASPKDHWFNRLDRLLANGSPVFRETLDPVADFRVSHRKGNKHGIPMRFGSFAHIERTAFTRRMADEIEDRCEGKLPIPSQDTLAWYCATLWKQPVKLMDMKKWFKP